MATIETLRYKINEYKAKYRRESLPQIEEGKIYSLNKDITIKGASPTLFWPDTWPLSNRRGIYAIFSHEQLLYLGKASQQPLGNRLGSYFHNGEEKHIAVTAPGHTWSNPPTHVITWAVPKDMPFEASALEEFLIKELATELPDNTAGKNT
jgi:hypothetical protein